MKADDRGDNVCLKIGAGGRCFHLGCKHGVVWCDDCADLDGMPRHKPHPPHPCGFGYFDDYVADISTWKRSTAA